MIIDNGAALNRHSRTGRPLNGFNTDHQYSWGVIKSGAFNQTVDQIRVALKVEQDYKTMTKTSPNKTTLDIVFRIVLTLLSRPDQIMALDGVDIGVTRPTRTAIINRLEKLDYIEVYQGFTMKSTDTDSKKAFQSRSMGLKASYKLLNTVV